jgi:integrase
MRMKDKDKQWLYRWKNWLMPSAVRGVWRRKEGGHFVRARVVDPSTGRMKEIKKTLPQADEATAYKWLADERARIRAGHASQPPQKTRFADFVTSLAEQKVASGDIRSAKGRERWRHTLTHLIVGTTGRSSGAFVPGFGEYFIDRVHVTHVETWRTGIATLIAAGDYSPNTCNGWLAILRVIIKAAKRTYDLDHLATEGVKDFDTAEYDTYTEEEPNALLPDEVAAFLETMHGRYPQHYAMTYLGLVTGLRPSSLRPLRRRGPEADVLWEEGQLRVRRSQTLGNEVMNTTKQKRKYTIPLPPQVMEVLRWHVTTQLTTPEQEQSGLLFPSVTGGFRSPSVLNKPFADIADEIGLGKRFTQCGLRRTFNDLARVAQVNDVVTRSISGHLTSRMQDHYSTPAAEEKREGIARVIELARHRPALASTADPGGAPRARGGAPGGAPTSAGGALNEKADEVMSSIGRTS